MAEKTMKNNKISKETENNQTVNDKEVSLSDWLGYNLFNIKM